MAVAISQASGFDFIKQFIAHQAENGSDTFPTLLQEIFVGAVKRRRLGRKMFLFEVQGKFLRQQNQMSAWNFFWYNAGLQFPYYFFFSLFLIGPDFPAASSLTHHPFIVKLPFGQVGCYYLIRTLSPILNFFPLRLPTRQYSVSTWRNSS